MAGWDWGRDLPSATSALLQAVEVAAAAEPRPSDALLPSPPSWKRHQRDVQPLPSPTDAIGRQPKATTTAVAAPALLLALAADPQSHVPAFAAGPSSEPAAIRRLTVEDSQSPPLVCRPVVHRQPQRQFSLASPVPPHASPAPQPASRANANPATHAAGFEDSITASSGFEGFPTETAIRRPAELVKLPLADHALVFRPQATAGSLQPRQGERAGSVLQSPFAAMADLPMRHQPGQTATAQPAPSSIVMQGHPDCQLAWSSAHALQHAGPQAVNQGHQVHAHQVLLGPAKPAEQQDRYSAQKLQREKLPPGLDSKAHHTLRLPLSPSSVNVLQPLAKAQAKALPWSSFLQSNSSKMHSLFHAQGLFDFKLGTQPGQPVSQSDLLPGRNVVVANASVTDLAHLLLPPSHWCW